MNIPVERVLSGCAANVIDAAIENNQAEYWNALLSETPGAIIQNQGPIQYGLTGLPHPLFNLVTRTRLEGAETAARVEQTIREIRGFRLPFGWVVGPLSRPPDLPRFLESHGLHVGVRLPGMAMDLCVARPSDPAKDVEEVLDLEGLDQWMIPCLTAFDMSRDAAEWFRLAHAGLGFGEGAPLRLFVGRDQLRPAACSLLYFGAGVAGLYCVGTLLEARRQGFGAAMVEACLQAARGAGYKIAILHSAPMGHNLYRRLGFKDYCTLTVYVD